MWLPCSVICIEFPLVWLQLEFICTYWNQEKLPQQCQLFYFDDTNCYYFVEFATTIICS